MGSWRKMRNASNNKQLCRHSSVTCKSLLKKKEKEKKRTHLLVVKCLNERLTESMFSKSFDLFSQYLKNVIFQVIAILSKHISIKVGLVKKIQEVQTVSLFYKSYVV